MQRDGFEESQRASSVRAYSKILGLALLVTLFTLGLIWTFRVPLVLQKFAFATKEKAVADLTQIESALREYAKANAGRYPKSLRELVTPDMNGYTFLKETRIPEDPWGNEYMYDPPEPGRPNPRVYTYGKDGLPLGEGDDADIDNLSLREGR